MPEEPEEEKTANEPQNSGGEHGEPATKSEQSGSQVEELLQRLEEARKSADTYKDQLLRKAADFENYRRRTEADFLNIIRNANEDLITAIIPILDDFSRSLKSGKEQKDHEAFYKGVELIYNKLRKVLELQGLLPFESVGKPFDVQYHDALLQVPRDDVPPHTVIEEVEQGYKLKDKILRHAKVIVSTAAELPPADNENRTEPTIVPKDGERNEHEKE